MADIIDNEPQTLKSYEQDGEKAVYQDIDKEIKLLKYKRSLAASRNPFAALRGAHISTEGPGR